ncbi:cysteine--tRNA ligase [Boseongicola sp. H5]|uniref:cysteine--tRNA ligase n=1 Tax=Boseongicola sp. H5 TaxID=2763261 RepID=UPI001D0BA4F4|nr:cysteine--tRNA ligase [Boseongicola sp. H5]
MVEIRLRNTKTRREERFTPLDPENVRMYVCGPTVYDRAHLGNARPVIVFDVLYRLLRHVYGEDHVTYVRNFTDVDDKINATAQKRKAAGDPRNLEELIRERTEETIGWYHEDMDALGALRPTQEPRATEWIGAMIAMIGDLVARGHAYEAEGHVLFAVESYADYGKLSGRTVEDMIAGARVEVAPYKKNPMDFVLWKPSTPDLPGWDGPVVDGKKVGRGRPGWHIECSAMARELLGESFDIHGGGIDLQFPHHENEIAQSMCAHPEGDFARVWMHNEMLQVEGKKMSKSLGNFFTVRDLLDQGVPGEVIRFVMLMTHYSKPMDWTEKKMREAEGHLMGWNTLKRKVLSDPNRRFDGLEPDSGVVDALADDLNTSRALARLFDLAMDAKMVDKRDDEPALLFYETLAFLGFDNLDTERLRRRKAIDKAFDVTARIEDLVIKINEARQSKNWDLADHIRSKLTDAGVRVMIDKSGVTFERTPDFDPSKLEAPE